METRLSVRKRFFVEVAIVVKAKTASEGGGEGPDLVAVLLRLRPARATRATSGAVTLAHNYNETARFAECSVELSHLQHRITSKRARLTLLRAVSQ